MGLFNRKREVGSNFDEKKADEIFDSIGETNEKKASDNIKPNQGHLKPPQTGKRKRRQCRNRHI